MSSNSHQGLPHLTPLRSPESPQQQAEGSALTNSWVNTNRWPLSLSPAGHTAHAR